MITVAIFAFLTVIIFSSFANDRSRSAAKQAASQMQVDIQAAQNSAQSGLLYNGSPVNVLPSAYGVEVRTGTSYTLFADGTFVPGSSSQANFMYDSTGTNGEILRTKNLATNLQIVQLKFTDAICTSTPAKCTDTKAAITFSIPTTSHLFIKDTSGTQRDAVDIVIKQTKLNLCYLVSVKASTATINRRQLTACP